MRRTARFGVFCVVLTLAACGGDGRPRVAVDDPQALEAYTPDQIFGRGEFELARNRTKDAGFYFSEVERLYPYSSWAKRALIMQAFAFHKGGKYEDSRGAAQRFLDFYPTDDDAPYAQ